MARYIDADKILNKSQKEMKQMGFALGSMWLGAKIVVDLIKSAPTADVVEVVRCEDCQHKEQCPESLIIEGKDKYLVFCSCGEAKKHNKIAIQRRGRKINDEQGNDDRTNG